MSGSFFNGCGKTRTTFFSYLIALPINVYVSIALINGLHGLPALGVVGAAWGTLVAASVPVLVMGTQLWLQNHAFSAVKGWSRDRFGQSLSRHFRFSWPIAATFFSMALGNQVCALLYANMSINAFAAISLVAPWVQVLGTIGMAWAQATGIGVAQLLGANTPVADTEAFLSRVWRMAFVAAGLVAVSYLIFILLSGRIYADLTDQTRGYLMAFLPILLLLPFPKGSNAICGQTLRASGDTLYVMNIFIVGQWLFKVPLTALFVLVWQVPVFWVFSLFFFEELVKFPLFHLRLYAGKWKTAQPDL